MKIESSCITFSLIIGLAIILGSCESISNPTLVRMGDVKLDELSTSMISMNVEAILQNDNNFALDLASADLQILIDEIEVAKVFQTYDSAMPAKSEFAMPLYIKMNLSHLKKDNPIAAVTRGLKIMSERQVEIQMIGTIEVGKGRAKIQVPVDQLQIVSF